MDNLNILIGSVIALLIVSGCVQSGNKFPIKTTNAIGKFVEIRQPPGVEFQPRVRTIDFNGESYSDCSSRQEGLHVCKLQDGKNIIMQQDENINAEGAASVKYFLAYKNELYGISDGVCNGNTCQEVVDGIVLKLQEDKWTVIAKRGEVGGNIVGVVFDRGLYIKGLGAEYDAKVTGHYLPCCPKYYKYVEVNQTD